MDKTATSDEILESTTCDKCDVEVGLTASHVPDSPVLCKACGGPWSPLPTKEKA